MPSLEPVLGYPERPRQLGGVDIHTPLLGAPRVLRRHARRRAGRCGQHRHQRGGVAHGERLAHALEVEAVRLLQVGLHLVAREGERAPEGYQFFASPMAAMTLAMKSIMADTGSLPPLRPRSSAFTRS